MTDYKPPLKDMLFNIHEISGLERILELENYADFDADVINQVVEEAGKFAADVLSPINISGDQTPCKVVGKEVVTAPEFAAAYAQFSENGWLSLDVSPEYDGMGMPGVAAIAAAETWQAACLSFMLCPMLTSGAISAIEAHGSEELRKTYLPKMASGACSGTMNLTESQAGSDLSVVATKAVPDGDSYRITGTKIFITWGDQTFTENVAHLVLARLPDAPPGVRGISLFLVPKYLQNADGSLGALNDVYATSVEHKLGIHGCPTCAMSFGENGGSVGYLVGEENKGLAGMFTMMNHARIGVGVQGLGISERAYQLARNYALDRKQGKAPGVKGSATIIHHPDVRRMLLVMKSQIEAMRAATYYTIGVQDIAQHSANEEERAAASSRLALLTPVIKAWPTEVAQELTSIGVQIHGGMGFVEETGAAQHMRDARILTIYEGTTGIQALDFVGRKIMFDEGKAIGELIAEMQSLDAELGGDERLAEIRIALADGVQQLQSATSWLLEQGPSNPDAPGSASVNLLMLAGIVVGGWQMARAALAITHGAASDDASFAGSKLLTVRFYAQHIMPKARAHHDAATAGADSVMAFREEQF
jgi:alkylation response protein AidB-like acyl-CoA dehydrogenase